MKNKQPLKNRLVLLKFEIIFSMFLSILVLQKYSYIWIYNYIKNECGV